MAGGAGQIKKSNSYPNKIAEFLTMASKRNIGLDYLRSLAIIIVLLNHCLIGFFFGTKIIKFDGFIASISASSIIAIEWLFVLSGFLIGAMMIRSFDNDKSWLQCAKDFWLRRWFRTIPNYYLFVLINVVLVSYGISDGKFDYKHLIFSQNLAWPEQTPHFFGEAWSLALDEWFYLLMPVMIGILFFLPISRKTAFTSAAYTLIILPIFGRLIHTAPTDFFQWDSEIRRVTLYHLDATGWGVLAAAVNKWHGNWWRENIKQKALIGFFLTLSGLFFVVGLLHPTWMNAVVYKMGNSLSITLIAGGTFLLVTWLTSLESSWKPTDWIVAKLSTLSYSIYLSHLPLIFILKHLTGINNTTPGIYVFLIIIAWLILIFAISNTIFNWFEKPIADLRELFTKRVDASPF